MEANGFNKSAFNSFFMTKETAEVIPAVFHPDRIIILSGRTPAVRLKYLYQSNKILAFYYLIVVSLYIMIVCTYVYI